jgi:membrane protein DedA with SNARE-associated domain
MIARHGYLLIFIIALMESLGFPVPAALAFVAGGAAVAAGTLKAPAVLGLAITAMLVGDSTLFVIGRYTGWTLLGFLCRLSLNPESCILRSAESFYKRGKVTLLFAKFIPGINTMAPPLAGSMKMRPQQFLRFDAAGASLYALAYCTLGYLFRDFLRSITRGFQTASHALEMVLLVAMVAYAGYRIYLYFRHSAYRVVPRVQVQELANRLMSDEQSGALVVDVRSHGYYDPDAQRIKGSVRLEPNNLEEELKGFPKDKDIYLYCT